MLYVNARAILERETPAGTELLLQVRDRTGEPLRLEFPGGQLEPYESILDALTREVREETGLIVTAVLDDPRRVVHASTTAAVECLQPFFVYQTLRGPVDSVGFFFRCRAEGTLTSQGDGARDHHWIPVAELAQRFAADPEAFDWLAQGAVAHYLAWWRVCQPEVM